MKGRIFNYSKYKAYNADILTSRVSPKNTSCTCARCGSPVARYNEGQEPKGYQMGAPLVYCETCGMRGNSDRNASLKIGNRLFERFGIFFEEKPQTLPATERAEQSVGVVVLQEPNVQAVGQLSLWDGHESDNGHGAAQSSSERVGSRLFAISPSHYAPNLAGATLYCPGEATISGSQKPLDFHPCGVSQTSNLS